MKTVIKLEPGESFEIKLTGMLVRIIKNEGSEPIFIGDTEDSE